MIYIRVPNSVDVNLFIIRRYLHHLLTARHYKGHGIHSPFVFHLVNDLFCQKHLYYWMKVINDIRKAYYQNFTAISMDAPFRKGAVPSSTISKVTQNSAIGRKHGELLFRLVCEFHPEYIIELGTSLGISTMYLASPSTRSKVFTIEGNAKHLAIAQNRFKICGLKNIVPIEGMFDEKLPQVLNQIPQLDFVYIDGNHQQQATIDYFNQCLAKSHNHTMMAFHDIHWSKGMEAAWKHICEHPQVTVSIDTFHLGLVFLRKECPKQHFVVRF